MNIGPSQSTLQAYGNTFSQTAPTAQTKIATNTQTAAPPAANSTQRADAVARPETPARSAPAASSEAREESRPSSSSHQGQHAAKIDILV